MKIFAAAKASVVFIKNRCRSSRSQMFFKVDVFKNFAIFTGKHLCWSLFLIKLQAFRCFPVNIAKFLRVAFLQNICFCRCSVLHYIFIKTLLNILQLYIAFFVLTPKITLIRFRSLCHSLSSVVALCHSLSVVALLIVLLVVIRCTTRCHLYYLLSFVVALVVTCTTRFHSLSLDIPLVCLFIKGPVLFFPRNFDCA